MSHDDEELVLGADYYLKKLLYRKSVVEKLIVGIQVTIIGICLILGIYSVYSCKKVHYECASQRDIKKIMDEVELGDARGEMQLKLIAEVNRTVFKFRDDAKRASAGSSNDLDIMFDCFRTTRLSYPSVVTYDGCFVDNTNGGMNVLTGIFRTTVEGVYQISFTAKYVSSSRGRFGAWSDIFVNDTVIADSQREYNGRSNLETESSTHTILVYYPLKVNHYLKVQFNKDGSSYIHSDGDHDVHFTAKRVGPIP